MLDYDKIPGTINLVDTTDSEVVLHPTPSANPDDPLNWTRRRKLLSMFCMFIFTLGVSIPSASIYSVLIPISESTGLSLDTLNQGTGYMYLTFGLGCIVFQPLSQQYGKRPIFLLSMLGTCLIQLWGPQAKNSGQWIGSKLLQGFLGAPVESLCEVVVSDVWFEHERGRWIGLYGFALMFASNIAPVLAGLISQGQDWKWVLYWGTIFNAVCFVFLFFFFEETNFVRHPVLKKVNSTSSDSSTNDFASNNEKTVTMTTAVTDVSIVSTTASSISTDLELAPTAVFRKKTFVQKLALFDKPRPIMLWEMTKRPFIIFVRFPVIVFSGFLCGLGLVWFNLVNGTVSAVLSADPYNFTPDKVGLCYISSCVVVFISSIYGGYVSDKLRINLAKRNDGVSEPEHRLWVLIAYLVLCPAMLVLWGVGAADKIHWFPIILGMGVVQGMSALTSICSVNYAVDSYREIASDSMVTLILIRNFMSFGIGYGVTPWFQNEGLKRCFGQAAGVAFVCISTFFIFIKWGKNMRSNGKHVYWNFVKQSMDNGLSI